MKQFLSNTVSPTVLRMGKEPFRVVPSPKRHSKGLIVTTTGVAVSCVVAGYFAQELPAVTVLSSLFIGFAHLFGLGVLLLIDALLISFLIGTVERALAVEDDGTVPKPHRKSKWRRVAPCLSDFLAHSLSLKEHSPPRVPFFLSLVPLQQSGLKSGNAYKLRLNLYSHDLQVVDLNRKKMVGLWP